MADEEFPRGSGSADDTSVVSADAIEPQSVEHKVAEIYMDGKLREKYNFIVYRFLQDGRYIWARAYADAFDEISVYGPFEAEGSLEIAHAPAFRDLVLEYLKRRFRKIMELTEDGYRTVWDA